MMNAAPNTLLAAVPTLTDLLREPCRARTLPTPALLALLASAAAVQSTIAAELATRGNISHIDQPRNAASEQDHMLTPDEAAQLLRRSKRWLYRHANHLPFITRISPKLILCSEPGIKRWLERQRS